MLSVNIRRDAERRCAKVPFSTSTIGSLAGQKNPSGWRDSNSDVFLDVTEVRVSSVAFVIEIVFEEKRIESRSFRSAYRSRIADANPRTSKDPSRARRAIN